MEEGLNVQVVMFPDGEDPDSYAKSHSNEELAELIEKSKQDFITFKASVLMTGMDDDPIKIEINKGGGTISFLDSRSDNKECLCTGSRQKIRYARANNIE